MLTVILWWRYMCIVFHWLAYYSVLTRMYWNEKTKCVKIENFLKKDKNNSIMYFLQCFYISTLFLLIYTVGDLWFFWKYIEICHVRLYLIDICNPQFYWSIIEFLWRGTKKIISFDFYTDINYRRLQILWISGEKSNGHFILIEV